MEIIIHQAILHVLDTTMDAPGWSWSRYSALHIRWASARERR